MALELAVGNRLGGPRPLGPKFVRRCRHDYHAPMRLRWLTIVLMGVGLLTACAQPEPVPTPTPTLVPTLTPTPKSTPTPTPTPTLTPTPIPRPVAAASIFVSSGSAPVNVRFSDLSQGHVTTWEWDFGDGTTSTEQHPTHEYTVAGSHTVQLTVSGPGGSHTVALPDPITVDPGPLADVVVSPAAVSLQVQETARLVATGLDQFGNEISDVTFTWTGLGPQGSIDETGRFTAGTEAGTYDRLVKVTATEGGPSRSVLIGVTIMPGPLFSAAVEPAEVTLDIGATQSFAFTALDEFGNEITDVVASWSVVPDVGAIDPDRVLTIGTVAGPFPSAVRVEAVQGAARVSAAANVSVVPDPLATTVVQPVDVIVDFRTTRQFAATGLDQYGNEIPDLTFLWNAGGGDITPEGLFTAGLQAGSYEVEVVTSYRNNVRAGSAAIEISPWSWWPADGSSADAVGENDGILKNGARYADGIDGQAFSIDGRNDYLFLQTYPDMSEAFTYSAWLYFNVFRFDEEQTWFNNNQVFLRKAFESDGSRPGIWVTTTDDGPEPRAQGVTSFRPETWYHTVGTWDGTELRIYVNGRLEDRTSRRGTLTDLAVQARIGQGGQRFLDTWQFSGRIDDVRIYSRALNETEVKALYDALSTGS